VYRDLWYRGPRLGGHRGP